MTGTTVELIRDKLVAEVNLAVQFTGVDNEEALERVEEAQQLLTAMRYSIWNTFHRSGEAG